MVTLKDIAGRLGIATSTVSKCLNNADDISDETKQLVYDTALEMGYKIKRRKNNIGMSERRVCILIDNMEYENHDQFGFDLILGFKTSATTRNWQVDIIPINLNASYTLANNYDSFMLQNQYSGAFLIGFSMHNDYFTQIRKTKIPTVLFDNHINDNMKVGYVATDCYDGIHHAIEHLKELGHKKIAFLNGTKSTMISEERLKAFIQIMDELNLTVYDDLMENGYYVPNSAKYHVPHFLSAGATAIVCASDLIASDVINEVTRHGYSVPDDISVIGFDDLPFSANLTPPLTTIRQDRLSLGKSALMLLDGLINDLPISRMILHAKLVERNSTAHVKTKLI